MSAVELDPTKRMPDWVSYDPATERLIIDGITFDRNFFLFMGREEIGTTGLISNRENGVVTILRVEGSS